MKDFVSIRLRDAISNARQIWSVTRSTISRLGISLVTRFSKFVPLPDANTAHFTIVYVPLFRWKPFPVWRPLDRNRECDGPPLHSNLGLQPPQIRSPC